MNIYEYIARNDPQGSVRVLKDFGYTVRNPNIMPNNLRLLVQKEGEPALRALLDIHPDKDVILEAFSTFEQKGCSCASCKGGSEHKNADGGDDHWSAAGNIGNILPGMNANTQASNDAGKLAAVNNALIIAGALLISTLILVNLKK